LKLAAHNIFRRDREHGFEHFDFLIADGFAIGAGGRFHCQVRQHLEQVVLDDVANGANLFVKRSPALNSKILRHGDLHTLDMRAVPEGFEHFVRKAEEKHAMHRLFAQVMVDAENFVFVEYSQQYLIKLPR